MYLLIYLQPTFNSTLEARRLIEKIRYFSARLIKIRQMRFILFLYIYGWSSFHSLLDYIQDGQLEVTGGGKKFLALVFFFKSHLSAGILSFRIFSQAQSLAGIFLVKFSLHELLLEKSSLLGYF